MRPYEQVLFQWSVHTLDEPGAELRYAEWIGLSETYPNFEFAQALKRDVGLSGTVLVWSRHEMIALRELLTALQKYGDTDVELEEWLRTFVGIDGPSVDLMRLAEDGYFHWRMKGSWSLKSVVPAVWSSSAALRQHCFFQRYASAAESPYHALQEQVVQGQSVKAVREGTAAVRMYQDMMCGLGRTDEGYRLT